MARLVGGKIRAAGIVSVAAVTLLSACAKSTTPSYGGGSSPPAPASSAAPAGSLKIATSSVSGVGTVLVDTKGFTLYHLKTETNGKIVCSGSCTSVWPPLLLPAGVTSATAGSGVSGKLGTILRPDGGTQVTYKGMPLYTYSGDQSPGQANGQGIQGVWFAMTPSGSSSAGGGAVGGGGGY